MAVDDAGRGWARSARSRCGWPGPRRQLVGATFQHHQARRQQAEREQHEHRRREDTQPEPVQPACEVLQVRSLELRGLGVATDPLRLQAASERPCAGGNWPPRAVERRPAPRRPGRFAGRVLACGRVHRRDFHNGRFWSGSGGRRCGASINALATGHSAVSTSGARSTSSCGSCRRPAAPAEAARREEQRQHAASAPACETTAGAGGS